MATMALWRPVCHIFPMLQGIVWNATDVRSLVDSVLLVSPTVTTFNFSIEDIEDAGQIFDAFFQEVGSRLLHIASLTIRTNLPASAFGAALTGLVSNSLNLKKCTLPKYGLTTNMFLALSRLPKL
jgi:hypothetical protein